MTEYLYVHTTFKQRLFVNVKSYVFLIYSGSAMNRLHNLLLGAVMTCKIGGNQPHPKIGQLASQVSNITQSLTALVHLSPNRNRKKIFLFQPNTAMLPSSPTLH